MILRRDQKGERSAPRSAGPWIRAFGSALIVVAALLLAPSRAGAALVLIDFESFADLDELSSSGAVSGATFTQNATVLASGAVGGSLNEFDFPPHSDFNVALDVLYDTTDPFNPLPIGGGPMFITFATPILDFSAFFTHNTSLTLEAFSDLAGTVLVDSVASPLANLGLSEQLAVTAAAIRSVRITGAPAGGSFTIDDIAFNTTASGPVPEPMTLLLFGTAAAAFIRRRMYRSA